MTEQSAQDRTGCSVPSVQTLVSLHIDLPHPEPEEVHFTIAKFLIQMPKLEREIMKYGSVSCVMLTQVANCCMDIIQTFAEDILDVVLPQVYRYMRIHGTFSPTVLGLTEDRIRDYLGDSIEQVLSKFLKMEVQEFEATKMFSQLLSKNITKTVNTVLAFTTQTPMQEFRVPVVFVSGCVASITDLKDMVHQIAVLFARVVGEHGKLDTIYSFHDQSHLNKLLKAYIIRLVKILKSQAKMLHCETTSRNHRDVCIRVGTNTQILTEEDSESRGQQSATSSYIEPDAIPGCVPDSNDTTSYSKTHFSSVTVIGSIEDYSCDLRPGEISTIEITTDELVRIFLQEDPERSVQTVSGGLEVVDNVQLRKLIDRIFNMVMRGCDYQIPVLPVGTRMCNTVIYEKLGRGDVNPGIVAHALYMRTEEVLTRCVMQVLLWPLLCANVPRFQKSPNTQETDLGTAHSHIQTAGDFVGQFHIFSAENAAIFDSPPEWQYSHVPLTLLAWEMLFTIGILYNDDVMYRVEDRIIREFGMWNLEKHFDAFLMGRSYKDISQTVIANLVSEFGSVQEVRALFASVDQSLYTALMRELKEQLTIPPVLHGKAACGFFKKFKSLCCKKTSKRAAETTPVISLTSEQDSSKLQDHLNTEEPVTDQTKRHQCPFTRRISTRKMYSRSKKILSAIARVLARPFVNCVCPESQ